MANAGSSAHSGEIIRLFEPRLRKWLRRAVFDDDPYADDPGGISLRGFSFPWLEIRRRVMKTLDRRAPRGPAIGRGVAGRPANRRVGVRSAAVRHEEGAAAV